MLLILTLVVLVLNAAEIKSFAKTCNDCVEYTSCKEAKELAFFHKGPETEKKFKDTFCGFDYVQFERIPKVCCSEFKIKGNVDTRHGIIDNGDIMQADNPKLKLLPVSCGDIYGKRIIGGFKAALREFKWMALIAFERRDGLNFLCSGSIINSRYILTAAHCADKKGIKGVRVGEYDIANPVDCQEEDDCESHIEDLQIEDIIIHEKWQKPSPKYDIALLRLKTPIDFNHDNVQPICLPISAKLRNKTLAGEQATVAGWGLTEQGVTSPILLKIDVPIRTQKECRNVYDRDPQPGEDKTEKQICAGEHKKDTCSGDSGGPLTLEDYYNGVARNIQYGITSYGSRKCGRDIPSIYTDVTKFIDWILDKMTE